MSVVSPRTRRRLAWLLACAILLLAPDPALRAAETGELAALRQHALELVNAARREHGRAPLTADKTLDQAAQDHAEDMLARGYYSHVSPEGEDARDRYLARGGDRWEMVAENIASCSPCAEVPREGHVEQMHARWMESPHHRENILRAGVARFGFGIVAGEDGPLFAVQTFAGPGTPRGTPPGAAGAETAPRAPGEGGPAAALAPSEADDAFARALNARREGAARAPLEASDALSAIAAGLLPDSAAEEATLGRDALDGRVGRDWASVSALVGSCGGCGAEATGADVEHFLEMWLSQAVYAGRLLGPDATSVGFALRAYGDGRKVAIAVLGQRG
jgi:uncharacterized protein YkwD